MLTEDGAADARALGLEVPEATRRSAPVTILFQGDAYYALRLEDGRLVQLLRGHVTGATLDSKPPTAVSVVTTDGDGRPGFPGAGDRIVLTYSEEMAPESILPGWTGERTGIRLRTEGPFEAPPEVPTDTLTFWSATGADQLDLGHVEFRGTASTLESPAEAPATIELDGPRIVVTLVDDSLRLTAPDSCTFLVWVPSDGAEDRQGNPVTGFGAEEQDEEVPATEPEF